MDKDTRLFIILFFSLILVMSFGNGIQYLIKENQTLKGIKLISQIETKKVKIASWNLQIFGRKKADNPELIDFYSKVLGKYDVVFVEEIRDKTGYAFEKLCSKMKSKKYNCFISSRAGRSSSKEQYGVFYKENIHILEIKDYNPDKLDRWERPPLKILFEANGYVFEVYVIHTKPEEAEKETKALEKEVKKEDKNINIIILGDFNLDCKYYNEDKNNLFQNWKWAINNSQDTTSTDTNCTYDRIILNKEAEEEFYDSGVFKQNINPEISDHYLVWAELITQEN